MIASRRKYKLMANHLILHSLIVISTHLDLTLQQQDQNETNNEYKRLERGYPSASGTWNSKNNVQSYGWNSPHPVDPCNQCIGLNYNNHGHQVKDHHYLPPISSSVGTSFNKPPYAISTTVSLSFPGSSSSSSTDKGHGGTYAAGTRYPATSGRNNEYRGNGYDNFSPEWKYREMMRMKFDKQQQQSGSSSSFDRWNSVQSEDDSGWQLISTSGQKPKYNVQEAFDRVWDNKKPYPVQIEGYSHHQDRSSTRGGDGPSSNWKPEWMQGGIVQGWIGGQPSYHIKQQSSFGTSSGSTGYTSSGSYKERPSSSSSSDQSSGGYDYGIQSPSEGGYSNYYDNNNKYTSSYSNKKKPNKNIIYYEYNLDDKRPPPPSSGGYTNPFNICVNQCKRKYLPPPSGAMTAYTGGYRTDQLTGGGNYQSVPDEDNYRQQKYGNYDYYSKNDYHQQLRRYGENDGHPSTNDADFSSRPPPPAEDIGGFQPPDTNNAVHGFRPLDETTKGISGWDVYGKGHYFATDDKPTARYAEQHDDRSSEYPWKLSISQQINGLPVSRPWENYVSITSRNQYFNNDQHPTTEVYLTQRKSIRDNDNAVRYSGHSGIGATTENGFPVKIATDSLYSNQRPYARSITFADSNKSIINAD